MATASVTNTFTNGTAADAIQVNTNFADLVSFLNNSVVHRDGTKAFTAAQAMGGNRLTGLGAPTADSDAARRQDAENVMAVFAKPDKLEVTTDTGASRMPFPFAATILGVYATVSVAPTGAAILIDVHKNGTTIFTTQGNRPTIAATAFAVNAEVTNMDVTAIAAGDYLTVNIDQIGSTLPGEDLVVVVRYRRS